MTTPVVIAADDYALAPGVSRAIIELIEELALRGGGIGAFGGCAAGDSAVAVVLRVSGG